MSNYEPTVDQFMKDIADHTMEVKLDQCLYRHLAFRHRSGRSPLWFDITTTPGVLMINGDMGTVVFSRVLDMFEFFTEDPDKINPKYWSEKIQCLNHNGRQQAYEFSSEDFRAALVERLASYDLGLGKAKAIEEQLDRDVEWSDVEILVRQQVNEFQADDGFTFQDTWEIRADRPTYQYIWLCRAICWAIGKYREQRNHPGIPEGSGGAR